MAIYKSVSDLEGVKVFQAGDEVHFWCGEEEGWKKETVGISRRIMCYCPRETPCLILGCSKYDESLEEKLAAAFPGRKFVGCWPDAGTPESLVDTCRWLMQHAEARWGKPPAKCEKRRPTVGDIVKIVSIPNYYYYYHFKCGDICKVLRDDFSDIPFQLEQLCGGSRGWAGESHVELVQPCSSESEQPAPEGFEKTWALAKSDQNIAALMAELLPVIEKADAGDLYDFDEVVEAFRGLCKS